MTHYEHMISIVAEQLTNEFPGLAIPDVIEKAKRLYAVMKLEAPVEEHGRIKNEIIQIVNYKKA